MMPRTESKYMKKQNVQKFWQGFMGYGFWVKRSVVRFSGMAYRLGVRALGIAVRLQVQRENKLRVERKITKSSISS